MSEQSVEPRKRRFFAGATIEQALVLAARYHGMEPTEISYRKLEKRHGFVRILRRVIVEVDPLSPRRTVPAPTAERPIVLPRVPVPRLDSSPVSPQASRPVPPMAGSAHLSGDARGPRSEALTEADLLASARDTTERILRLAGLELSAEIRLEAGEVCVELRGRDRPLLLEDEAEVLLAIEHLVPRCLGVAHADSLGCRVDSEGFRSSRDEELRGLATNAAATVRATGQVVKLEPLSPPERRLIHLTLADVPDVVTESEGDGHFKRVTIRPT